MCGQSQASAHAYCSRRRGLLACRGREACPCCERSTAGNLIELHQRDSALFDYQRPTIPSDITPVEIPAGTSAAAAQTIINAAPANSWFYIRANAGAPTIYQEWQVAPPAGSVFIGERDASGNLLVRLSGAKDIKSGSNSYQSGTVGTNAVYLFTSRTEKPNWVYAPLDGVYIASGGTGYPASGAWSASNGGSGTYTATSGVITSATVVAAGSTTVTDNCTITISGGGTGGVLVPVRGDSASSPPSPFKKSTYAPTITIEKSGTFYCCPAVDSLADCQNTVFSHWFDYNNNSLYINTGTAGAPNTFDYLWLPTTSRAFTASNTGIINPLAATGRIDCVFTGLIVENYWGVTLQESPFFRTPSTDMTGWAVNSYDVPSRTAVVDCELRYNTNGVTVGSGGIVRRNYIHHNYDVNISATGGYAYIEGNKIQYGNNCHATWKYNSIWESGNSKFSYSYYCTVVNNLFSDARGKGIWFDLRNDDALVAFNVCENNTHSGIMYEVSWGGRIISNWCYGNGFMGPVEAPSNAGNNYANIYVSSSCNVEVAYNVIWCRGPVGTEQTNGFGILLELQKRVPERATKRGSTALTTLAPSMWGVQVHHNCTVFPTGVSGQFAYDRAITGFVKDVNWQTDIGYATNTEPLHWLGGPDAGNGNFFYNEFYYVSSATATNCRHWQVAKQFNGGWNQTIDQVAAITRSVDASFPHCGQFYGSMVITPGTLPPDPGYQAGSWVPNKKIVALLNTPFVLAAKAS